MSLNLKTLALARDIETAFKNHLGTDSFPTEEWPALALAIAKVIEASGNTVFDGASLVMDLGAAQELVRRMSALDNAIADLVGL